ncbi:hypothetical protein IEO21_07366 [Rhodonia placenta]|uniref:Uncharacterized protein n=1 Tax=Rhodonia placenta TaxID=104341 RepID=A0A8H7NY61_9APHY|nr:hypothetical protein IEO21_07366 [Postia placenta]
MVDPPLRPSGRRRMLPYSFRHCPSRPRPFRPLSAHSSRRLIRRRMAGNDRQRRCWLPLRDLAEHGDDWRHPPLVHCLGSRWRCHWCPHRLACVKKGTPCSSPIPTSYLST